MDSNNMYQNNNGYQGQEGYGYQQEGYQNQNGYGYQQDGYQNQNAYAYQQDGYQNKNGYQNQNAYAYNNMYPNFMPQDQPISMWGYLGYQLLFALPCIGFIFVLVFSFAGKSIHVKNFARSYLCFLLIVTVLGFIVTAVFGAGLMAMLSEFRYGF